MTVVMGGFLFLGSVGSLMRRRAVSQCVWDQCFPYPLSPSHIFGHVAFPHIFFLFLVVTQICLMTVEDRDQNLALLCCFAPCLHTFYTF